ncbi:uncharacterized protein LOC142768686 isoform X1 [Rhipicephalus microplus]|uniref:uncharacterized protein LOC142768686 isoform X1 n=1 Tax=Rhipicephalus microplus TaxID=6941 RepID=UPI003F6C584B
MKEMQHEEIAKIVLALGTYDFANIYRMKMKQGFRDAVKNLKANIVILIASAGWISPQGACVAAPPNPVKSSDQHYFDLGHAWYAVSQGSTYKKPSTITGISFEMSALQYVMNNTRRSLNVSLYKPCVSVMRQRQALCEPTNVADRTGEYLGSPTFTYGIISNSSKVLTLGELNNTLALKLTYATQTFGELRANTAWLLYNVHNLGIGNQCGDRPFEVIRQFCYSLKGASDEMCRG